MKLIHTKLHTAIPTHGIFFVLTKQSEYNFTIHLKLFVAVTDKGLFRLRKSNSQGYHGPHGISLLKRILNRNNRLPVEQHQAFPLAVQILVAVLPAHFRCTMMRPSIGLKEPRSLITIP